MIENILFHTLQADDNDEDNYNDDDDDDDDEVDDDGNKKKKYDWPDSDDDVTVNVRKATYNQMASNTQNRWDTSDNEDECSDQSDHSSQKSEVSNTLCSCFVIPCIKDALTINSNEAVQNYA